VVLAGLLSNIALAGTQILAVWCGDSRAVLADGVHSASDVLGTLLVLLGLGIARRPADESHPYGHGKAESMAEFLVGIAVTAAGAALVLDATRAIGRGAVRRPDWLPFAVACGSILAKGTLYPLTTRVGRDLGSPGVRAVAAEYRTCVASSSAAAVGILGAWIGLPEADPLAGLLVGGLVLGTAG
jgi:cation diffusion facilitator family transporter